MHQTALVSALVVFSACHRSAPPQPSASTPGGEPPVAAAPAHTGGNGRSTTAQVPSATPADGPQIVLRPEGQPPVSLRIEVQRNEQQRARGLMFRRELDELAGMLFVFPGEEHLTFWMRNTYLPLDMIFITRDRRVLGVVRNATPMTDDPREVPGESMYVLEVRAGFAERHHIAAGTPVDMVAVPPADEESQPGGY